MTKHPRLPPRLDRVFARTPLYFVTFCTYRGRPLLATPAIYETFIAFCERAYAEHNITVGRYVLMPDHVHLFICGDAEFQLGRWMGMLKQALAKSACSRVPVASVPLIDEALPAPPTGRRLQVHTIWQRGFFDHVLRSDEATPRNGTTCAITRCAPVSCRMRMPSPTAARSSASIAPELRIPRARCSRLPMASARETGPRAHTSPAGLRLQGMPPRFTTTLPKRDIVVIGVSAGGVEALQ